MEKLKTFFKWCGWLALRLIPLALPLVAYLLFQNRLNFSGRSLSHRGNRVLVLRSLRLSRRLLQLQRTS